jgi:Ni/Co efflux regulator RcnB
MFAAVLSTGVLAPMAEADSRRDRDERHHSDRARPWRGDRDHDRDRDRYRHGRSHRRWHRDPVYQHLNRRHRIRLNNYYHGGRYISANRYYGPEAIRFIGMNPDGTYSIWFRGSVYTGYSRYSRGHRVLYLGSAPTRFGYQFEIILD